jgi:hypothetical protein
MMSCNMSDLYVPHQKKKGDKYIYSIRLVGGKVALILVVSSSGIIYANVVGYLQKSTIDI